MEQVSHGCCKSQTFSALMPWEETRRGRQGGGDKRAEAEAEGKSEMQNKMNGKGFRRHPTASVDYHKGTVDEDLHCSEHIHPYAIIFEWMSRLKFIKVEILCNLMPYHPDLPHQATCGMQCPEMRAPGALSQKDQRRNFRKACYNLGDPLGHYTAIKLALSNFNWTLWEISFFKGLMAGIFLLWSKKKVKSLSDWFLGTCSERTLFFQVSLMKCKIFSKVFKLRRLLKLTLKSRQRNTSRIRRPKETAKVLQ